MIAIFERVFGCSHKRTTFPISRTKRPAATEAQNTYIVCLECGKEFDYDWQAMKIGGLRHFTMSSQPKGTLRTTAGREGGQTIRIDTAKLVPLSALPSGPMAEPIRIAHPEPPVRRRHERGASGRARLA